MMKKQSLLFIVCSFYITLVSCSSKEVTNDVIIKDTVNIIVKDTIYVTKEPIISNDLYLYINEIFIGDSWTDKENEDFFYRLLFSSMEEMDMMQMEKIKILEGDKLELINRIELSPEIFGLDFFDDRPQMIEWLSPTVVKLLINKGEYNLDVSKMKVVK